MFGRKTPGQLSTDVPRVSPDVLYGGRLNPHAPIGRRIVARNTREATYRTERDVLSALLADAAMEALR